MVRTPRHAHHAPHATPPKINLRCRQHWPHEGVGRVVATRALRPCTRPCMLCMC